MEPDPKQKNIPEFTEALAHLLVAEDHDTARSALKSLLEWKGYIVTTVENGNEALDALAAEGAPSIALLDWEMPGMSGPDICRTIRGKPEGHYRYLIIITAREGEKDIAEAMAAGADDFIRKPFGIAEVVARIRNGERMLRLERSLSARIGELERSIEESRQLKRLLPICSYCKSIRDDTDYWQEIEQYIHKHTGTDFTHGICPACMKNVLKEHFGDLTAADTAVADEQK